MKKQLLLLAFSALALTSCKDDDDIQAYEMDMMKGDWKISKIDVISGKDDKTVIQTSVPTGCAAKDNTFFRTDYYTSFTSYAGIGTDCQVSGSSEGTYTYDTETKKLVINYKNESPIIYQVVILTSSEMRFKQISDNVDMDGDMIPDAEYISYKR